MRNLLFSQTRSLSPRPIVRSAAIALAQKVGVSVILITGVLGLIQAKFEAARPTTEELPGSGIVMRTEVTIIWIPQALLDLAQREADSPVVRSHAELRTHLERHELGNAWYALTYRGFSG